MRALRCSRVPPTISHNPHADDKSLLSCEPFVECVESWDHNKRSHARMAMGERTGTEHALITPLRLVIVIVVAEHNPFRCAEDMQ